MALTAERNTPRRSGDSISLGVAADKVVYAGSLVARDASGYATPGATATTLIGMGRAKTTVDNSGGSAADLSVEVEKGVFQFANSATDAITIADIGASCYIEDDQTVAKSAGETKSVAGTIFDVDSDGVWVKFE